MDNRKRKIWSDHDLGSSEYIDGLKKFVKHAFEKTRDEDRTIACPCAGCVRYHRCTEKDVFDHLVIKGPMRDFEKWYDVVDCDSALISPQDGQTSNSRIRDNVVEMLGDAFGIHNSTSNQNIYGLDASDNTFEFNVHNEADYGSNLVDESNDSPPLDVDVFNKLLQEAEIELYPGCEEYSKLSFILHLYNIKCSFGWSDKSFSQLLEFLKKSFPKGAKIPDSIYETKKIVDNLTLKYEKIDACEYDCMLFRKEYANYDNCIVCGASRWKISSVSQQASTSKPNTKEKKIPVNFMRYFPLKSRLQRFFMCSKIAELMRWHDKYRPKEAGVLRHPADSESWKNFKT